MAFLRSRSSRSSRYFCRRRRNLSSMVWALSLSCIEGSKSSTFAQSPCKTPCRNCITDEDSKRKPDSFSRVVAEVLFGAEKWRRRLVNEKITDKADTIAKLSAYLYPRSCNDCTISRTSSCFLTCLLPCSESWTHSVWPFVIESDAGVVRVLML